MNGLPTRVQCEGQVLNILEAVRKGSKVESDTVELKSEWREPGRAARQICGLCNASRGAPALLIIGADDETSTVVGAPPVELANWIPQLMSYFEGVAPQLVYDMTIPSEGVSVRALLFETDRAPYVVKVPESDRLEVAFRSGTRTRSARREDLIRMLAPATVVPSLELMGAQLQDQLSTKPYMVVLRFDLYCIPRSREPIGIAAHRTEIELWGGADRCAPNADWTAAGASRLDSRVSGVAFGETPTGGGKGAILIDSPQQLSIFARLNGPHLTLEGIQRLGVRIRIHPANASSSGSIDVFFRNTGGHAWRPELG